MRLSEENPLALSSSAAEMIEEETAVAAAGPVVALGAPASDPKVASVSTVIQVKPASSDLANAATKAAKADAELVTEIDPDYEFYDSLKQGSWPVPINKGAYVDGDLAERERPVYNLQAASFRSQEDAERLVSRLKAHRLKATVVPSVSSNGQYWYQVSVGPFVSNTNRNKAQDTLVSMNMMPLKKRVQ